MSLISVRNFLTPFTSMVHVITMTLLVIVYVVFRLSSGTVTMRSKDDSLDRVKPKARDSAPVAAVVPEAAGGTEAVAQVKKEPARKSARGVPSHTLAGEDDDLIAEMLGSKKKKQPAEGEDGEEAEARPEGGGPLDEIAKELGLR